MTTRDHARRAAQRFGVGERRDAVDPGPSLPDRLIAARERKGVDLVRAERDTKIRVRYLSALESGDYRDLPGRRLHEGLPAQLRDLPRRSTPRTSCGSGAASAARQDGAGAGRSSRRGRSTSRRGR